jgi:hypothetical protein
MLQVFYAGGVVKEVLITNKYIYLRSKDYSCASDSKQVLTSHEMLRFITVFIETNHWAPNLELDEHQTYYLPSLMIYFNISGINQCAPRNYSQFPSSGYVSYTSYFSINPRLVFTDLIMLI